MTKAKTDIYQQITNEIIKSLESGVKPWIKPWQAGHKAGTICKPLRHNLSPYSGINILVLWMKGAGQGYNAPIWMTYKQAAELGGQVKKNERGTNIVYANTFSKTEENESGQEKTRNIPYLKTYSVFNVEQIERLPEIYYAQHEPKHNDEMQRLEHAEQFFKNTNADIRHGGGRAFFSPSEDYIQMPAFESFSSSEAYTGTLAHEVTHWTGHTSRLDRLAGNAFGSADYAKEELIAELGAAFVCADLDIIPMLEHHTSYINSWLKVLKNDKRAIFSAASQAQKAAEYLHSLQ